MKTKEEIIQEVYGEFFDEVKDYIDENGRLKELWGSIFYEQKNKKLAKTIEHLVDNCGVEFIGEHYAIPKSLQGIESNNGWTRIESEEDYDKLENGEYEWYNINTGKYDRGDLWSYGIFTHYKIIPKTIPRLPFY